MKKLYVAILTIIITLGSLSFVIKKPEIKLIAEYKYSTYRQSAWGFDVRNDLGLISMNHSFIGAYLFDSSFNVIKHYETQNGAMGGGNGQLSPNGILYSGFEKRQMDDEIDTLSIYNIETKTEKYLTFPMSSNYKWFNDSKRVLVYKYGKFDIYDIDKGLINENVINLNDEKYPLLASDYILLEDDKYLVTSNRNGDVILYNTQDWSINQVLGTYGKKDINIELSDNSKFILVKEGTNINAYSTESYKKVWSFKADKLQNICELSLSYNSRFMILVDCNGNVYYADINTQETSLLIKNDGDSRYSAVCILKGDKEFYLDRNGNTILHYSLTK